MTDTQGTSPTDDESQPHNQAEPQDEAQPKDAEPANDSATTPVPPYTAPAASAHNGYPPAPPLPGVQQAQGPAAPSAAPTYAGAPAGGQAFGPAATAAFGAQPTGAHPTLPLGPTPGAAAPPSAQKKSGAGRVAGLIVAAALVGGAAGLGGAYAGTQLWASPSQTVVQGGQAVTVNNPDKVNATTNVRQLAAPEGAVNINMGTLVGSYANIARMLDEMAEVPNTGGVLLTFDDFIQGVEDFGTKIQPLMKSRAKA